MPVYEYKALNKMGKTITSKIEIEGSEAVLRKQLTDNGLKVISVKKKNFDVNKALDKMKVQTKNKGAAVSMDGSISIEQSDASKIKEAVTKAQETQKKSFEEILKGDIDLKGFDFSAYLPVPEQEVISFTEMFLLLKKSNFTNIRAINTLYNNATNMAMKSILRDMINGMETGNYIYSTMEYYPKVFKPTYVNLVRVGEKTGSLVNSLEQALTYLIESRDIRKRVKKALVGPLVQSVALILGGILCIIFGLPVMEDMYASYGLTDQIPKETMAAANFVHWCGEHWYILLAVFIGLAIIFNVWVRTTTRKVYVG